MASRGKRQNLFPYDCMKLSPYPTAVTIKCKILCFGCWLFISMEMPTVECENVCVQNRLLVLLAVPTIFFVLISMLCSGKVRTFLLSTCYLLHMTSFHPWILGSALHTYEYKYKVQDARTQDPDARSKILKHKPQLDRSSQEHENEDFLLSHYRTPCLYGFWQVCTASHHDEEGKVLYFSVYDSW